ncbi:MAG: hypothetical protein LBL84_00170 [Candidatus Nomurabacteria bacterium]|jgi:thymidylate kinase|nr:hypothetical protein [Candidatus Nomurabacteria bacterium]
MADDPAWLKEVLKRGYKPSKTYLGLDDSLLSFVRNGGSTIHKIPAHRIYVLEGLPGSGKSTTIQTLKNSYGLQTIDQILPHEPKNDQSMSPEFYFKSDELKTTRAIDNGYSPTIIDRYYVSTLAFYWASDRVFGTNNYKTVFSWYEDAMRHGKLLMPFSTFYIDIDVALSSHHKKRVLTRSSTDAWTNSAFVASLKKYYEYFFSQIEPRSKVIRVSSTSSLKDIEKSVIREIYDRQ